MRRSINQNQINPSSVRSQLSQSKTSLSSQRFGKISSTENLGIVNENKDIEENIEIIRDYEEPSIEQTKAEKIERLNEHNNNIQRGARRLKTMTRGLNKVGYFSCDTEDGLLRLHNNSKYFYHRHVVSFSISQYNYFLLLHIIYYAVLGPFIAIPGICSKRLRNLNSNLLIIRPGVSFWAQNYYWVTSLLIYYSAYNKMLIGDFVILHTLFLSLVLRSSTIAGKYATFQKTQLNRYFEEVLTIADLNKELMMYDWLKQKPEIIESELENSFSRRDVDRGLLKIAFLEKLSKETEEELKKITEDLGLNKDTIYTEVKTGKSEYTEYKYYDATYLFHYLTRYYNQNNKISGCKTLSLYAFSGFYALLPGFLRILRGKKFHGEKAFEIFIFYFTSFGTCFLVFTTIMFYILAVRDLNHKKFVLEQLGHMISPKKDTRISHLKLLPTINVIDVVSLSTWVSLRKLCLDYGKKFFYRHQLFMPIIFIIGLKSIISAFIIYYIQDSRSQEINDKLTDLIYFLILDFFLMFYMFFMMLYGSALINKEFDLHIEILKGNRDLIKRFIRYEDFYFKDFKEDGKNLEIDEKSKQYSMIFGASIPKNYLQKRLSREVLILKEIRKKQNITQILEDLLEMIEGFVLELEDEKEYGVLKVLGFTVSTESVRNLMIGFASIAVTAYEVLLSS